LHLGHDFGFLPFSLGAHSYWQYGHFIIILIIIKDLSISYKKIMLKVVGSWVIEVCRVDLSREEVLLISDFECKRGGPCWIWVWTDKLESSCYGKNVRFDDGFILINLRDLEIRREDLEVEGWWTHLIGYLIYVCLHELCHWASDDAEESKVDGKYGEWLLYKLVIEGLFG